MNMPIPEFVSYVPVPCVCDGIVLKRAGEASSNYEVAIDRTPLGAFQGSIKAHSIYHPPMDEPSYIKGDRVKLMVVFLFDVNSNKFDGVAQSFQTQILGKYDPETILDSNYQHPISEKDDDRVVVKNKRSEAAVILTNNREATITPGGSVSRTLKAFGAGTTKNCDYGRAQNYHRIISHNDPAWSTREHFGMFAGIDPDDESTRSSPEDTLINYRRFVQQTRDPVNWVSVCDGAYAPWMGANNDHNAVSLGKEVLHTQIINADKNRITKEYGEVGTDFIMMRVDDVIPGGELPAETPSGVTPGVLGNRFKMGVSEKGEIEIYAAGSGIPTVNFAGFKLTLDADGNLTVFSKGKIIFTHGDSDEAISSIVMDPSSGIDVTAKGGFRVNGKSLMNENFFNWFNTNYTAGLVMTMVAGAPVPGLPNPAALPTYLVGAQTPVDLIGFLSSGGPPLPAVGLISQPDTFATT